MSDLEKQHVMADSQDTNTRERKGLAGYLLDICLAIDRLGNALTGGDDKNTISGRTGYWYQQRRGIRRVPWAALRAVIDLTFYPLDGKGHCEKAEKRETAFEGSNIILGIVTLIAVVPVCVAILAPLFWLCFPFRNLDHGDETWTFGRKDYQRWLSASAALPFFLFVDAPLLKLIFVQVGRVVCEVAMRLHRPVHGWIDFMGSWPGWCFTF